MKQTLRILNIAAVLLCATAARADEPERAADDGAMEQSSQGRTFSRNYGKDISLDEAGVGLERAICHRPDLDYIVRVSRDAAVREVPTFCRQAQDAQVRLQEKLAAEHLTTEKARQRLQAIDQQDKVKIEQAYDRSPMGLPDLKRFFQSRDEAVARAALSRAAIDEFSQATRNSMQTTYKENLNRRFNYLFPHDVTIDFNPPPQP